MNIPSVDLKQAISLYYNNIELSNRDIASVFSEKVGSTRIQSLKKLAKTKMIEKGTLFWNAKRINTRDAFEAWGLDIEDLERRYKRLEKLKLI